MLLCNRCNERKPQREFYPCAVNSHGSGVCKVCYRARVRDRRRNNPAVQEYERKRAKLATRRAAMRAVADRWRHNNPAGYRAQNALNNALRDGRVEKGRCAVCGSESVHGHYEDYSKLLDVVWLCPLHHHRLHAERRRQDAGTANV